MKMNIKKRLALSNLLMLFVPVGVTLLTGLLFLVVLFSVFNSKGFLFREEHFYDNKDEIVSFIDESLKSASPQDRLSELVASSGSAKLRILIAVNRSLLYDMGTECAADEALLALTAGKEGGIFVSDADRQLYRKEWETNDSLYEISVFCNYTEWSEEVLIISLAVMMIGLVGIAVVSILIANRFLSRSVFRKIERPLDKLLAGAREVSSGNLDYTIKYEEDDEFKPAIDEFNTMTKKLRQSVEMLRDEENSRQMLIVGITHDIKSPLTSVIGYVEGLCDGVADTKEKQARYLQGIRRKCGEINALVTKMIVLTKSEYELANENGRIFPDEEIRNFLAANGEEYLSEGLRIVYSGGKTPALKISPEDFTRLLRNIADNSLRYKKSEEGSLTIRLSHVDGRTELSFADDGIGVPSEALPHLFEAFYRADKARTFTASGNGLGLAIVRKIVTAAGGEVNAYNNEQGGLTVFAVF